MKIAILVMFNGLSNTYSLVNVVAEHLKMLLDAGVETKVLVSQDCPDNERQGIFADERLEWVKITNKLEKKQIHWHDYSQPEGDLHDTFFDEADTIARDFESNLADVDVCIMHDIHYQGWHLIHNVAIRKAQEKLPNVKFVAVTHSAPVNRPNNPKYPFSCRYTLMPDTTYVYPTQSGIPALAKQYNVPEGKCRVVYNSLDIISMMSDDVKAVQKGFDLLTPDILIVYPGRFTTGKKFEKVAALAGAIRKKTELSVKVVFCDFPCIDIEPEKYKLAIRKIGCFFGLNSSDMAFTGKGCIYNCFDEFYNHMATLYSFLNSSDVKNRTIRYTVKTGSSALGMRATGYSIKVECLEHCYNKLIIYGNGYAKRLSKCNPDIAGNVSFILTVCKKAPYTLEYRIEIKSRANPKLNHDSGFVRVKHTISDLRLIIGC